MCFKCLLWTLNECLECTYWKPAVTFNLIHEMLVKSINGQAELPSLSANIDLFSINQRPSD